MKTAAYFKNGTGKQTINIFFHTGKTNTFGIELFFQQNFYKYFRFTFANSFINQSEIHLKEAFYPLHAFVCEHCYLVQLENFESPKKIFGDYIYFSSYSESWLKHSESYANSMLGKLGLNSESLVIEVASNDGYLLQYFQSSNVQVLGIEPAENVAKVAEEKGVPTRVEFFGTVLSKKLVSENKQADLLIGNNVLAHVPDLNDFVEGLNIVLAPDGVLTMEFPHLLNLIKHNQFDTIYHEHFSYLSFLTVEKLFSSHGLTLFDVEELSTHGGSLRIYANRHDNESLAVTEAVSELRNKELKAGLAEIETYNKYAEQVRETKRKILEFLIAEKRSGKTIVAYGAPAKGNTLLNYCGIRTDFIDYTVDRSPHKQGTFLPGTHIPVYATEKISETRPDYVLILPWNLKQEIMQQLSHVKEWGGKFVVPIPELKVLD